jgi:hypothetical protein
MPGYLDWNALAMVSATDRSIDVYQTTLPYLRAAAISSGVTRLGAGAAANARRLSIGAAREAAATPWITRRRETFLGM